MDKISYRDGLVPGWLVVYLGRKKVGEIHRVPDGFQYVPRGSRSKHRGEVFKTLDEVKRSLQ